MLELTYAPIFIKEFKKLEAFLQEEVKEKIELFKDSSNHKQLRVHKLKGPMKDRYSFSVSYSFRVVFSYASKTRVNILSLGDHDIYD